MADVAVLGRPRSTWWQVGLVLTTVLAIGWPLLRPGLPLTYDQVWTPWPASWPFALGLGPGLPRAVPGEAALAAASHVLPTWAVSRALLAGVLVLGCVGILRLVRTPLAGVVAVPVWACGAYVTERLTLGHWTLLAAAAVVPWVLHLAGRVVRDGGGPRAVLPLLATAVPAALSPTGVVVWWCCATTALLVVARRRALGPVVAVTAVTVLLACPWIVAGATAPASTSDPAAVAAFAARNENVLGLAGAVLVGGGIWNADVVPWTREGLLGPVVTLAVLALAATGWRAARSDRAGTPLVPLVVGLVPLVLVLIASTPPGRAVLEWVVVTVPGGGLLRDTQKWLAPWACVLAVLVGRGAEALLDRVRRTSPTDGPVVVVAVAALVVVVHLAQGAAVAPALSPVRYPASWGTVREAVVDEDAVAVAVLPWNAFRAFTWTQGRTVLDPAARALPVDVVATDELVVDGRVLRGEDPRAAAVGDLLRSDDLAGQDAAAELGVEGVSHLLVHRPTASPRGEDLVIRWQDRGAAVVVDEGELVLLRLPGPTTAADPGSARAPVVVAAHLVALTTAVLLIGGALVARRRPRRPGGDRARGLRGVARP